MDSRFSAVSREDIYTLQMELKQVQVNQNSHAERLLRLEKRQTDDAIKSVWNSPFPGVLSGTPQQGPVQIPHSDMFDDLDEQGEQLLGSLHLGPAEEEPTRRGAASRANSVRFDESALHGSSWGGHNSRHSGDFGPIRPGSSLMMERTLSHKSDGRHSSAGHSVHSHHSVASGRASSLGMDTNYPMDDDDDDESFEIPGPPISLYVLGSVPSIVRCWLTTTYAHNTLLYADICTGAQKSTVDLSLVKELDLVDEIQRENDGINRIRLNVYFAEAIVTQHSNRSSTSEGAVPSITVLFEVTGIDQPGGAVDKKLIRIFIGSDALRSHSADVLFSSNTLVLFGDDRERLRVPFVRPEDETVFRHISTAQLLPEKPKLNANAAPFVFGEQTQSKTDDSAQAESSIEPEADDDIESLSSPKTDPPASLKQGQQTTAQETRANSVEYVREDHESDEGTNRGGSSTSEAPRKEAPSGIWGSWRNGSGNGTDREISSASGYQPAARSGRGMKILKPQKSTPASGRAGSSYEPPLSARSATEGRRKSQSGLASDATSLNGSASKWDAKRSVSSGNELKSPAQAPGSGQSQAGGRENRNSGSMPRSANPVGGASAFSWMAPPGKVGKSTTTE